MKRIPGNKVLARLAAERAPVDVLAVIELVASGEEWRHLVSLDQVRQSLAAVAELVEAAKFAKEVLDELGAPTRGQQQEMSARLRAALAKFGGAA